MFRGRIRGAVLGSAATAAVLCVVTGSAGSAAQKPYPGLATLAKVNHIVVIYEENHSFDNLYGGWEGVNGLANAKVKQVNQSGNPFNCVLQQDVNLTVPPLQATCTDSTSTPTTFTSHFANSQFTIDSLIPPTATTCPKPGVFAANGVLAGQGVAGGCTRDLVHRFYQEQYQLDNGKMDRYVTGSDATGLTLGVYDTKALPIYKYLHGNGHPRYAIEDDFFQGAFGGSYLAHQWLICACAPIWVGAPNDGGANDLHSVIDGNGMPNNYPNYSSPLGGNVRDLNLTASCNPPAGRPAAPSQFACGDYSVNTTQPTYQPFQPGTASTRQLPPLTTPNIGDRLTAAKVDWAWYSGGWSNADGEVGAPGWTNGSGPTCSDPTCSRPRSTPTAPTATSSSTTRRSTTTPTSRPARRPARRISGTRSSSRTSRRRSKSTCKLKPVSFIKPIGEENEHPGYASESRKRASRGAAQGDRGQRVRQGHDGDRHLRRVRRTGRPRRAARHGRRRSGAA